MIHEDYIISLIRRAMEFISKALGLAKEGEFLQSEGILKDSFEDITGINADTLISMDIDSMNLMLGDNVAELIVTAEYFKALGKVYKEKADLDGFILYYKKGLYLLLSNYHRKVYEINMNILLFYAQIRHYLDDEKYLRIMFDFFMDRCAYKKALEVIYMMTEITDDKEGVLLYGENFFDTVLRSSPENMEKAKWSYDEAEKSKVEFDKLKTI
ncbi:MAG: hypothetical protein JXQ23_00315 [Clostridia bacterium]|nr:hypothetical protein [Clostridia bacterium]